MQNHQPYDLTDLRYEDGSHHPQLRRIRRILEDCRLTRAYEQYSEEFDREEARLAAQGAPNQCPYPLSR
jgi:hypothetical protein